MPDPFFWHQAMLARRQYPDNRPPGNGPLWLVLLAIAVIVVMLRLMVGAPDASSADRTSFLHWNDPPAGFVVVAPGDMGHIGFNPSNLDTFTLDGRHVADDATAQGWAAKGRGVNVVFERTNRDVINSGSRTAVVFYWEG